MSAFNQTSHKAKAQDKHRQSDKWLLFSVFPQFNFCQSVLTLNHHNQGSLLKKHTVVHTPFISPYKLQPKIKRRCLSSIAGSIGSVVNSRKTNEFPRSILIAAVITEQSL